MTPALFVRRLEDRRVLAAPTLDPIADVTISEDAGTQTVDLTGITDGELVPSQPLQVTAQSSDTSLIPDPNVTYTSPDTTGTLDFAPVADQSGTVTITVTVTDGGTNGTLGDADDESFSQTFTVTVGAVNDPPSVTVPGPQTVDEDTVLDVAPITVDDVDATTLQVDLSVASGTLTLGTTTGLTFVGGTANGQATITVEGSQTDLNNALATLDYLGNLNFNGSDTLNVTVSDLGATGSGGTLTDSDSVAITVNAVNDAPSVTVPGPQSVDEDTVLDVPPITVSDVDASTLQVDLSVSNGTLTLGTTTGLTFVNGTANGQATITVEGTQTDLNNALATLDYLGDLNFNGSDTLNVTVSDLGATGSGGTLTDSDSVAITVNAVNDAPTVAVPGPQTVDEDTVLDVPPITVADVDASTLQVDLSVASGTLTLGTTTGLTFVGGTANGQSTITVEGSQTDLNNALATLDYLGDLNFNGSDTLNVTVSDLGATGSGGTLTDSDSVAITVNAVNDAPSVTVPGPQTVDEDTVLDVPPITVSDVDASTLQVDLSVSNGTLTLGTTTGLTFVNGTANGQSTITVEGSQTDLNNALATLDYLGDLNFNGSDTLNVTVSDLGATGSGGTLTDSDSVAITVNAVNDAPTLSLPGPQTVDEDTVLDVPAIVADDVEATTLEINLSVTSGTLTLGTTTGLTFKGGTSNGDSTLHFEGSKADVNAALASLDYLGNLDFNGSDTLSVTVSDLRQSPPPALTASGTVDITVNAVNDAPSVAVPGPQTVDEDTVLDVPPITVDDVEATSLQVDLSVSNGTLTLGTTTGLTFLGGTANGQSALSVQGTKSDLNNALATLDYLGDPDFNGSDTLVVTASDLGASGSGGALSTSETVAIAVQPVNDPPSVSVPGPQSVDEDTVLNVPPITVADIDAGTLQVDLSVSNGTLTLGTTTGLTFVGGTSNGQATLMVQGSQSDLNTALATLQYQGNLNFNGADTLNVTVSDLGNTGSGGTLTDADSVAITVNAVNDAPTLGLPGPQSADEDTAQRLDPVTADDVDASTLQVDLSVSSGTLTLGTTTGLTFVGGTANGQSTLMVQGTKADLNAALATIDYLGNTDFNGSDTLTVTAADLGASGSGGPQTTSGNVAITVNPVNDAPSVTVPGPQSVDEDAVLDVPPIIVDDLEATTLQVDLSVANGTLTLGTTAGLTFVGGTANGQSTLMVQGTKADLDAALATLDYQGDLNFNGSDTLNVTVSDLGATGSGGTLTDSDSVAITVNPVNDAPTVAVPGPQSVDEDTVLDVPSINVDDVDASTLQVDLSVSNGTLTLGVTAGLTFLGGTANGQSTIIVQGDKADLNVALATLDYRGNQDFNGSDTLNVTVSDLGASGSGGTLTDAGAVPITVRPVNDPPVAGDVSFTAGEDDGLLVIAFNADDVDADDDPTTLSYLILSLPAKGTIVSVNGDGTFTFDLGSDFQSLRQNQTDTVTFDYQAEDSSGARSGVATVSITVVGVNDAPVVTRLDADAASINETGSVTVSGSYTDIDTGDTHAITIDWGDGTTSSSASGGVSVDPSTGTFQATHTFRDDDPSGTPADVMNIVATASDNFGGSGSRPVPVTVHDIAPVVTSLNATEVNALGEVTVTGTFTDVGVFDTHIVIVDWSDGNRDAIPVPLVAGTGSFEISHQFIGNPDRNNPAADIFIRVTVVDDDSLTDAGTLAAPVPGEGLQTAAIDTTPPIEQLTFPLPSVTEVFTEPTPVVEQAAALDFQSGQTSPVVAVRERIVLRVVSPDGEEVKEFALQQEGEDLESVLNNLPQIFRVLPDDHYRIYLIREDGTERLVLDFYLRDGKQVDPETDAAGDSTQPGPAPDGTPVSSPGTDADSEKTDPTKSRTEHDGSFWERLWEELQKAKSQKSVAAGAAPEGSLGVHSSGARSALPRPPASDDSIPTTLRAVPAPSIRDADQGEPQSRSDAHQWVLGNESSAAAAAALAASLGRSWRRQVDAAMEEYGTRGRRWRRRVAGRSETRLGN